MLPVLVDVDEMDPGSVHSGRLSSDIFTGPLDHDGPMPGQHPHMGPGTPPMDSWSPYGGMMGNPGFIDRRSPNMNGQLMPMDGMAAVMGGPMGVRLMPQDMPDNARGYPDYGQNSNHVEVY